MELNAEKMRVFIIEPKTGISHELPGVIGSNIGTLHVDVGDFKPKQNPESGLYSWHAEAVCKITRRDSKRLLHLFRPRVFKYIAKDKMARHILANSKEGAYTYEQLMRMSAKQLKPLFAVSLCAEYAKHVAEVQEKYKNGYPCGGIVPKPQVELNVNTGEAVMSIEKCKQMVEEFKAQQ